MPGNEFLAFVISAQPDYKKRAMQAGAKEFITKPLNSVELLTHVHNMLQARLSHKETETQNDRNAVEQLVQERTAKLQESEELFR